MAALRIEGYVIVSADGMLANAQGVMPDHLKFEGDKQFFNAALDRADLIVHGRNSFEGQPNSPRRKRIVLTRTIGGIAPDPSNPKATLWNPAGASFEAACEHAGVDPAPSRSLAGLACSACSWTATIFSGCHRRRGCESLMVKAVSPACPRNPRSKFSRRTASRPVTPGSSMRRTMSASRPGSVTH